MAYSYTEYTGGGSITTSTIYTAPPYLEGRGSTDIKVTVDGSGKIEGFHYELAGTAVTFKAGYLPTNGQTIRITRSSSQATRLNDYADASLLTADTLDADANQLFFIAQEALDTASETNLAAGTFYFSQANAPSVTVRGTLWYDLTATPNILKVYNGTEWEAAVPIHDTKVYKNAVNSSQGILAVSDASGLGLGSNYTDKSYITDTAFNSSGFVFLNGVKLVAGDAITDIAGGFGDYFHDAATNRVYFTDISDSDELVIETFSGSFSQEVTDKEAAAQVAKTAAEAAQNAAETAKTAAETAETNAAGHSSTASGHKDTATTQAGIATTKAGEAATSASTAATKASEAATSASNAATSESNAASTLANAVTLNTNQTITGAKDFTGTVTAGGLSLGDDQTLSIGASDDFTISHNSTNHYTTISETHATGGLDVKAANFVVKNATGTNEYQVVCQGDGANNQVLLYHGQPSGSGDYKLATTSTGVEVKGTVTADGFTVGSGGNELTITTSNNDTVFRQTTTDGNVFLDANNFVVRDQADQSYRINCGDSDGVKIYSTGSANRIETGSHTEGVLFKTGADGAEATRAEITNSGLTVNGTVTADGLTLGDSEYIKIGAGNGSGTPDLQIFSGGANAFIEQPSGSGTTNLIIRGQNIETRNDADATLISCDADNVSLNWQGASGAGTKLATTETGIDVNGTVTADSITSAPTTVVTTNNTVPTVAVNKKYIDTYDSGVNAYVLPTGTVGQMITFVNASTQNITLNRNTNSITLEKVIAGSDPANVTDNTITVGKSGAVEVVYTGTNTAVIFGSGIS